MQSDRWTPRAHVTKEPAVPSGKDDLGIPTKGSALQLAYYVNCDREALDARIRDALSLNHVGIQWTSPSRR